MLIIQHAQSILKCIFCHDTWTSGPICACGAVYHDECIDVLCLNMGCGKAVRHKRLGFWARINKLLSSDSNKTIEMMPSCLVSSNLKKFLDNPTYDNAWKVL